VPSQRSGPKSFPKDSNDFALALYGQLRQQSGNLFFSPFSIRTAQAMAYAGARGNTAAEMGEALCFAPSDVRVITRVYALPSDVWSRSRTVIAVV
jgi:serpin B